MRTKAVFLLVILFAISATAAMSAKKAPAQRFNGSYDWSDGGSGELSAIFKPNGEGSWKVEFSFRFSGKKNNWKGRASGSLDEGGKLSGSSGWSGRNWEFEAEIENGVMRGTHTEIKPNGDRYSTGSFELRR